MSQMYTDVLSHAGPWTERDYLALPEDGLRTELLDGALLVNPPPGGPHQRLSRNVSRCLLDAAPRGNEVLEGIGIRIAPGSILIPDVTVITNPGAEDTVWQPTDIAMAVEITSPGGALRDRTIKPELYATARVPYYLHIEVCPDGAAATLHRLDGSKYVADVRAGPGEVLRLAEPFSVTLDLATLATATHPGR